VLPKHGLADTRWIWQMYKEEMDLSKDLHDLTNRFNNDERHFISHVHVLAFFTASEVS